MDNLDTLIEIALLASAVTFGLWLVLAILARQRRQAYNLVTAETAQRTIKPDFLTVNRAARETAVARGAAFEESARTASPNLSGASTLTRRLALGTAVASFITAATSAVQKAGAVQDMAGKSGYFLAHLGEILARYWIGFTFAAVVILGNLALLLYRILNAKG